MGEGEKKMTLDELRERKHKRDAEAKARAEVLELEALQVAEDLVEKGLTEGVDFRMCVTSVGVFAVQNPDFLSAKQFADRNDKNTVEDVIRFASLNVIYPKREALGVFFQSHGGIGHVIVTELMAMYHARVGDMTGK